MKPRLQRLVLKLEPIPGALPQAVDDGAPLALNRYAALRRPRTAINLSTHARMAQVSV